jgi:HEPN domain-containing protein
LLYTAQVWLKEILLPLQRADFQRLARQRLREARVLLRAGYPEGAYYLAGFAVECALKACIAKGTRKHDFPDKRFVEDSWVHDLKKLLKQAGLSPALDHDRQSQPSLARNWGIVKDWSNESRYERITPKTAKDFYQAVVARSNGILAWIRQHW